MDALIRYVCTAPAHAKARKDSRGDLTVHDRSWAFCPAEARDGHQWHAVGGVTVSELRSFGLRAPEGIAS